MFSIELNTESIKKIQGIIAENNVFAITTHYNSDGDAIGSATAVAEVLRQLGKTVKIVLPNDFPSFFKWMKGSQEIINFDRHHKDSKVFLAQAEVLVCLDFNRWGRLDKLEPVLEKWDKKCIVIDHHLDLNLEADAIVSVPDASSTCELVYQVLNACGYKRYITRDVAESLYTGIMTDTGRLDYASSYAGIYNVVGALIEKHIRKAYIHDKIYNVYTYDRMSLQAAVLKENMVFLPEHHAAYMTITLQNKKDYNFQLGDSEGFVNIPLAIKDVKVSALFTEYENGTVKVSLRSKRDFPASDLAADFFSGGGHFNAAGGKISGTLQDAIALFQKGLEQYGEKLR